jgi:uncharacterized protein
MRSRILFGLAAATIASCVIASDGAASADPLADGQTAYKRGDYVTAARILPPIAAAGNPSAQATLGMMYNEGAGVLQDFGQAMKWWKLAAAQGNALAQISLGLRYSVTQDFVRAGMWLNVAGAQGYPRADEFWAAVASRMTKDQIAKAQALARECIASRYKQCD